MCESIRNMTDIIETAVSSLQPGAILSPALPTLPGNTLYTIKPSSFNFWSIQLYKRDVTINS